MRRTMAPSKKISDTNCKISKVEINLEQNSILKDKVENDDKGREFRYFSVAYGKPSKKKHKLWDGDGILTLSDRNVSLRDSEGKELGSTLRKQLSEIVFEEGATLHVAGKYVEILSAVTKPNLKSSVTNTIISNDKPTTPSFVNREFRPVVKPHITLTNVNDNIESVIFPRPSADHIFRYNQNGSHISDVILDKLFSTRMRPHQIDGVIFLYECVMGLRNHNGTGAILADAMGLGKSVQSIALIWTLLNQGPYDSLPLIRRCLIVCPCSLVLNWKAEFQKWLGNLRIEPFCVVGDCRIEKYISSPKSPILIVSYEMMTKNQQMINELAFDIIICDEAHRLKNSTIKTSLSIESLSIPKRVLLTGTPLQNDMEELYALSDLCIPRILGESKDAFRKRFVEPISKSREPTACKYLIDRGLEASMELERLTKSFMLRRTEIVNKDYLPSKDDMILFCRPTEMQLTLYRLVLDSQTIQKQLTDDATYNGCDALSCISLLRKICNDPSLFIKHVTDKENCAPSKGNDIPSLRSEIYRKLLFLANESEVWSKCIHSSGDNGSNDIYSGKLWVTAQMLLVLKPSDKIVIASHFTKTLDILQRLCEGWDMKIFRIDGGTPSVVRMKTVDEFNNITIKAGVNPEVLLLSCKAGGEGLNLVGASRIILYDLDWNPAVDAQALARVWRDGQKKRVAVYRLVTAGTVEESLLQRQVSKDQLSNTCVDRSRQANTGTTFSAQELKNIFTLHSEFIDTHGCWTHQLLGCECQKPLPVDENISDCLTPPHSINPLCQLGLRKTPESQQSSSCIAHLSTWTHWINEEQIRFSCTDKLILNGIDQISSVFHRTVTTTNDGEAI